LSHACTDPESEQTVAVGRKTRLDVTGVIEALKTNALLRSALKVEAPAAEAPDPYRRSFLVQRFFIGLLGVALPLLLVGFGYWIDGDPVPRNSLSVYYYSGVGAVFVGVLTTVAFFLITYKLIEINNLENWLSILAGVAVLVVVLFPTNRPDEAIDPTPLQKETDDSFVNWFHVGGAVTFIVLTGLISIFFAYREFVRHKEKPSSGRFWWFHLVSALFVWGGGIWILVTELIGGPRWSVFAGEVASFTAFGLSWLTKGTERRALFGRKLPAEPQAVPPAMAP
jgi:hypothetical protein